MGHFGEKGKRTGSRLVKHKTLQNYFFKFKISKLIFQIRLFPGLVIYAIAVFINIPLLIGIFVNSEATIKNLKQFSIMFQRQAMEMSEEKDRTEILLSEMLPKLVAQQLSEGQTVEAETFEVVF